MVNGWVGVVGVWRGGGVRMEICYHLDALVNCCCMSKLSCFHEFRTLTNKMFAPKNWSWGPYTGFSKHTPAPHAASLSANDMSHAFAASLTVGSDPCSAATAAATCCAEACASDIEMSQSVQSLFFLQVSHFRNHRHLYSEVQFEQMCEHFTSVEANSFYFP